MYIPSVVVNPVLYPAAFAKCAISLTVVVLPFVPVTATIGILEGVSYGNNISIIGFATLRVFPAEG
jgi:hypothetical protein